jgi:hypothetical protein
VALGVDTEKASSGIECGMMPRAREQIERAASVGLRMEHAVGGDERESPCTCQCHEVFVAPGLSSLQVALDFDENALLPKNCSQGFEFC